MFPLISKLCSYFYQNLKPFLNTVSTQAQIRLSRSKIAQIVVYIMYNRTKKRYIHFQKCVREWLFIFGVSGFSKSEG